MLPGAGATTNVWWQQVRPFSRRFNLALVDFPGHFRRQKKRRGSSTEVGFSGSYDFDVLVVGLAMSLRGAGVTEFHLVTLSLGTILGRAFAIQYPRQVLSAT